MNVVAFIKTFLRKYSALILPVSLLLGGALLFLPTMWFGAKANAARQSCEAMSRELDTLIRNTPTRREAELKKQALQQFQKEVESLQTMALETTKRELIQYGLFPEPQDTSSQVFLNFGKRYRSAIEHLITERLNALDAPSESEIRAQTGRTVGGVPGLGGGEAALGRPDLRRGAEPSPIVDALCLARAERISMYANPRVLNWYDFWESYEFSGSEQAIKDCWFSQVAYWIYEDVVASIETMNAGSFRVADSAVKRLLGVSFQRPVTVATSDYTRTAGPIRGMGGMSRQASGDQPAYILPGGLSPLVSKPWTGRVGGEDLDVVHFAVSVIVDSRYVQAFIKELCSSKPHTYREGFSESGPVREAYHNQITVLQSTCAAVDKEDPVHTYYRYGTEAAMRVDLVCEYLFYRKAYDEIKPEPIKVLLGQSDQVQTTPGMGPGMMPGMMPGRAPGR